MEVNGNDQVPDVHGGTSDDILASVQDKNVQQTPWLLDIPFQHETTDAREKEQHLQ